MRTSRHQDVLTTLTLCTLLACGGAERMDIHLGKLRGLVSPPLPTTADVAGFGSDRIGSVEVSGGSGTIELDGAPVPVLVYERIPWLGSTLDLFQAVAVGPTTLYVFWFYCQDGRLTEVDLADTTQSDLTYETGRGSCTETPTTGAPVAFPALDVPAPSYDNPYQFSGPSLSLPQRGPGQMTLDGGTTTELYPFATVDCSHCADAGWLEVHTLLWEAQPAQLDLGIFYLQAESPSSVLLAYRLDVNNLTVLPDLYFAATWGN